MLLFYIHLLQQCCILFLFTSYNLPFYLSLKEWESGHHAQYFRFQDFVQQTETLKIEQTANVEILDQHTGNRGSMDNLLVGMLQGEGPGKDRTQWETLFQRACKS